VQYKSPKSSQIASSSYHFSFLTSYFQGASHFSFRWSLSSICIFIQLFSLYLSSSLYFMHIPTFCSLYTSMLFVSMLLTLLTMSIVCSVFFFFFFFFFFNFFLFFFFIFLVFFFSFFFFFFFLVFIFLLDSFQLLRLCLFRFISYTVLSFQFHISENLLISYLSSNGGFDCMKYDVL